MLYYSQIYFQLTWIGHLRLADKWPPGKIVLSCRGVFMLCKRVVVIGDYFCTLMISFQKIYMKHRTLHRKMIGAVHVDSV